MSHHAKHGTGNRIFQSAWAAFREGVERAQIELPLGQMTACAAAHLCELLHDGWRQHPCAAKDSGPSELDDDHAVRALGAGSPEGSAGH